MAGPETGKIRVRQAADQRSLLLARKLARCPSPRSVKRMIEVDTKPTEGQLRQVQAAFSLQSPVFDKLDEEPPRPYRSRWPCGAHCAVRPGCRHRSQTETFRSDQPTSLQAF